MLCTVVSRVVIDRRYRFRMILIKAPAVKGKVFAHSRIGVFGFKVYPVFTDTDAVDRVLIVNISRVLGRIFQCLVGL